MKSPIHSVVVIIGSPLHNFSINPVFHVTKTPTST